MNFLEKNKKWTLLVLSALAAFLILFHFTDTPMPWSDEGLFTETAKNLALHGVLGVQTAPGQFFPMNNFLLSVSYPVMFPIAGTFLLFGTGIWQARLTMVVYMALLVVAFYLFTRKRYGFGVGVLSSALLLSFAPFYGNGRPVQGEVSGLAWMVLGGWALLGWEESGFADKKKAMLAGLFFGLGAAVKPIFLLGIPASLLLAFIFRFGRSIFPAIRSRLAATSIFFVSFCLPVAGWVMIHLPTWQEAKNFFPNYIYFSSNHDHPEIPLLQNILTNLLRFATESTPIIFSFAAAFILLTVFLRLRKNGRQDLAVAETVLLVFIALNWVGYLKGTGWYRYFFPAQTLLYLFFPAAVFYLASMVQKPFLKKAVIFLPAALLVFQTAHMVFFSDTNFLDHRDRTEGLTAILSSIPADKSVMFYGSVEAPIFLQGSNYSQYEAMGGFLDTGNRDIIENPTADYILIRGHDGYHFPCYDKVAVNRYDFFTRRPDCSNP